jgi:hypothetical protein
MTSRPIKSCPKDGSEFLAYDPIADKFDVCLWFTGFGISCLCSTQSDGEWGPFDDDFQPERATRWWPLPKVK